LIEKRTILANSVIEFLVGYISNRVRYFNSHAILFEATQCWEIENNLETSLLILSQEGKVWKHLRNL
ncbi:MAG: hypothetical protein P8J33_08065, partial [Pirellulaceae bacterium]|nr:hypothetical protein [Pirellulaceae bacterium]